MREPVVALLGDLNADVTVRVGAVPPPGGEAHVETALMVGGSAALTARWLAALGCEVRLAAAIGEDPFGDWVHSALSQEGVLTSWLQRVPDKPTGLCFALVYPGGERTLLVSPGAARDLSWGAIPPSWLDGADWLHLSGYAWVGEGEREAAERAVAGALERGIPVSLDPGAAARFLRTVLDPMPAFDLVLPNRWEVRDLTGEGDPQRGAAQLRGRGVGSVAVKLDRDGCLIASAPGVAHVPAVAVEAENTTGAGDAFNAGAIVGILMGWPAEAVGALGNFLGAAAVRRGAGGPLPTLADLQDLLDRRPGGATLGAWLGERWRKEG